MAISMIIGLMRLYIYGQSGKRQHVRCVATRGHTSYKKRRRSPQLGSDGVASHLSRVIEHTEPVVQLRNESKFNT